MQKITTFLMFKERAEEAVRFYASVFGDDAEVTGPMTLKLFGQQLYFYNGGPEFDFSTGMSLLVDCADQAEVDRYWERLGQGGEYLACGWLKDRYGVPWQIVPRRFFELSADPDPAKSKRVFDAMLKMVKFDVAALEAAYRGD